MVSKWTVTYVTKTATEKTERKEVDIYAEQIFQAWYNAMCIIQIKEKTENFEIKSVKPKSDG